MEQMERLKNAIDENICKLEEVKQERLSTMEETLQCYVETDRRMIMMMEGSEVVDELQQLGHLLQEERLLSEQLNSQTAADRAQRTCLEEMYECVTNKEESLAAQILDAKQRLSEAKAQYLAAQALSQSSTSKPKRTQRKPK